jgi:hypothetical protein
MIVGMAILCAGSLIIVGGIGAFVDTKQPEYVIGFLYMLFGCLVLAIGAKAMGWIQ